MPPDLDKAYPHYSETFLGDIRLFARITFGFELVLVGFAAKTLTEQSYVNPHGQIATIAERVGDLCMGAGESVLAELEPINV